MDPVTAIGMVSSRCSRQGTRRAKVAPCVSGPRSTLPGRSCNPEQPGRITRSWPGQQKTPGQSAPGGFPSVQFRICNSGLASVEGVAARAGVLRVGVVDREALLLDGVDEVDDGAVQVGFGHPVDRKPD